MFVVVRELQLEVGDLKNLRWIFDWKQRLQGQFIYLIKNELDRFKIKIKKIANGQ